MSPEPGGWRHWWDRVAAVFRAPTPTPAEDGAPSPVRSPTMVREVGKPRVPIALHLGIDFGTRFTKVCFRNLGSDQSGIVTFAAPAQSGTLETALLNSRIVLDQGRVVAGLSDREWEARDVPGGATPIDFIKIRLAQLDQPPAAGEWAPDAVREAGSAAAIEALATYFLASVIRRACRWVETCHAELLMGRVPQWSFSVGLPVKYVDSASQRRFERVLRAAATLARRGVPEEPTLDDLNASIPDLMRSGWAVSGSVQPEIAAAVRSFIASPRAMEGIYVYIDVGAGTVDGASFRFYRPPEERSQLNFYWGEVQPLGVAAVAARLARHLNRDAAAVERALYARGGHAGFGELLELPQRLINRLVATVILMGRRADPLGWDGGLEQLALAFHKRRRADSMRTADVPLFIGGGGSLSPFYRAAIMATYKANNLYTANIRPYALEEMLVPDDLAMGGLPADQFHRFAVAYGLSIPPDEAAEIGLPSADGDVPPPRRRRGPDGPAYEDTKDLE